MRGDVRLDERPRGVAHESLELALLCREIHRVRPLVVGPLPFDRGLLLDRDEAFARRPRVLREQLVLYGRRRGIVASVVVLSQIDHLGLVVLEFALERRVLIPQL